ncbi:MAG TPA: hypothetical protein VK066_11765 [Chloroflexota bacterium]|nr:hypothetical protein [Chloroflexota bacterium]
MRRGIILAAALIVGLSPGAASAQTAPGTAACQDQVLQNTLPLLQLASRFTPSGIFPVGYAPLSQPFATSPFEGANAYPAPAYYNSYAQPPWALQRPDLYPSGYPQASVYPQLYPDGGVPIPAVDPNPELSSANILDTLQRDGTFDQLTSGERANFLLQLAALQQSEVGQRIAQAGLQQNAQTAVLNTRRLPYDLSIAMQSNSRDWFQSYVLYAATVQNLVAAGCNTNTGLLGSGALVPGGAPIAGLTGVAGVPASPLAGTFGLPGTTTPFGAGGITALSTFCRSNTLNLPICNGLR